MNSTQSTAIITPTTSTITTRESLSREERERLDEENEKGYENEEEYEKEGEGLDEGAHAGGAGGSQYLGMSHLESQMSGKSSRLRLPPIRSTRSTRSTKNLPTGFPDEQGSNIPTNKDRLPSNKKNNQDSETTMMMSGKSTARKSSFKIPRSISLRSMVGNDRKASLKKLILVREEEQQLADFKATAMAIEAFPMEIRAMLPTGQGIRTDVIGGKSNHQFLRDLLFDIPVQQPPLVAQESSSSKVASTKSSTKSCIQTNHNHSSPQRRQSSVSVGVGVGVGVSGSASLTTVPVITVNGWLSSSGNEDKYVHTYIHPYIHTYIHTYTHTYIFSHIHTS